MGEQMEDQANKTDMNTSEIVFDNLTIMKEFSNIVNLVRNEEFLETVPKEKMRRLKWVPMFNCLKQGILDEMLQELSSMWNFENMPEKLDILEKQKEKFAEINSDGTVWRPKSNDVSSQLKAPEVANLKKQKVLLESLAKEYESRTNRLKKILIAKRGYLKVLQLDIQNYHKKTDEIIDKFNNKMENHNNLVNLLLPNKTYVEDVSWTEKEIDLNVN